MEKITTLKENQVFVFGSNANGNHAGGAARQAVESFGAIMGQAKGLQGNSYAIVTLDKDMQKVSLEYILQQLNDLNLFAEQHKDKEFLLTLIGCGIAGFSVEDIKNQVCQVNWEDNVIIPDEFSTKIIAYKGFDKDFKCRNMQYEVGKSYRQKGEIKVCGNGFHACENPFDVLNFYSDINNKYCQVEQVGVIKKDDIKNASSRIKVNVEIGFVGLFKAGIEWIKQITNPQRIIDTVDSGYNAQIGSSGNDAKIGSSGYNAQIGSSGNSAKIGSSGDSAQIGSSGNGAKIGSSGYNAKIGSSGYNAQIGSSGNGAKIGSSGNGAKIESLGDDCVICCAGVNSIVKAKIGSWITLSEWVYDSNKSRYIPICVKTEYVDGDKIKADTWYKLVGGKFEEQ